MTNQTAIISQVTTSGAVSSVNTAVNHFVTSGIGTGYINFDIQPMIILPEYASSGGLPTGNYCVTVQINYYDPSIM